MLEKLTKALGVDITVHQETAADFNLELTRPQFEARMLKEKDGLELLRILERGAGPGCEQLGLMYPYKRGGTWHVSIPRWFDLLRHLRVIHTMQGMMVHTDMDIVWNIHQDRCKEKTDKGNIYFTRQAADKVADRCEDRRVRAYKCQVCPWWHVGKESQ